MEIGNYDDFKPVAESDLMHRLIRVQDYSVKLNIILNDILYALKGTEDEDDRVCEEKVDSVFSHLRETEDNISVATSLANEIRDCIKKPGNALVTGTVNER